MKRQIGWLVILLIAGRLAAGAQTATLNEDLLAAARRSDADAVKTLLAKGADVNAKSPYGATPLFFACDRGSVAVVKLLLEAGADINARDTFYKATPLAWAIQRDHADVVALLVAKAPQLKEIAAGQSIMQGQTKTAVALLALGGYKPESLSLWLGMAEKNDSPEIVEALKKAGAKPKPKSEFKVEPGKMGRYEGTFKNEQVELVVKLKDGKLIGTANGFDLVLQPVAEHVFEPEGQPMTITFRFEGENIVALVIKGTNNETTLKKAEVK